VGPTAFTSSAARLTQRVPWLCAPLSQEVCLFDCPASRPTSGYNLSVTLRCGPRLLAVWPIFEATNHAVRLLHGLFGCPFGHANLRWNARLAHTDGFSSRPQGATAGATTTDTAGSQRASAHDPAHVAIDGAIKPSLQGECRLSVTRRLQRGGE
jgi:hypothetical protein